MKRKWVDLFLFYSTLVLIFTGIVLYIMPHGRVAYFTGWTFLGLDKDAWDNLHIVFAIVMSVFVLWHIILNWKALKKFLFQKESFFAFLITTIIFVGTVLNIQPFKAVSDLEEKIKNAWPQSKISIPIAHAELLRLDEFCKKLGIPIDSAVKKLKEKGFEFKISDTLKVIAKKNNTTPAKIYEIIKPKNSSVETYHKYCV